MEIFKDVPNYKGLYQISNLGRVKSLERFADRGVKGLKRVNERILKLSKSNKYLSVSLNKNSISKKFNIHQLVAIVFLDHKMDGTTRIVVDHINNNQLDNNVCNLQLISHRENISKDIRGSSRYVGVHYYKRDNNWVAYITKNRKRKHLGYFDTEIEASLAYKKALINIDMDLL